MKRFHLILLMTICSMFLCAGSALGDWLLLKDGRKLRGVSAKKLSNAYKFTLENGEEIVLPGSMVTGVKKSPKGETVEFRGKSVTLREKVRTLVKERRQLEKRMIKDVETWARGKSGAQEAQERIKALPDSKRGRYLALALQESKKREARILAARQLGGCDTIQAVPALAMAAVRDSYRSVRDTSLRSLRLFKDGRPEDYFIPYLQSSLPQQRVRAANALSVFPSRKAVSPILATMHLTWSGFGRGFFAQVTQRAYIADYELVSGGTGFSIIEVADPVVRTTQTGVALDVDVRKVEMVARLRALNRITGQNFGTSIHKWRQWWSQEQAKSKKSKGASEETKA